MLVNRLALIASLGFTFSCVFSSAFAAPSFVKDSGPSFSGNLNINAAQLCDVAGKTLNYINQHPDDLYAVNDGVTAKVGADLNRVRQTLSFICQIHLADKAAGRASRLNNSEFLTANFEFIRWYPDTEKAQQVAKKSTNDVKKRLLNNIPEDRIFLTKYYTKLLKGSAVRTKIFSQALYALPFDEAGLSQEEALRKRDVLTRFKFTRQQIIQGALLDKKLAKPLVWITEEALHDVLLQGTGVLEVDGKTRYFNVHRNNDIAYDYHIGKREQARYWYFAEVPSIMGYGKKIDEKIALAPHVSVAGNVQQLGLGKLFLFDYEVNGQGESRLTILADEGGAFVDNLFQLDLLVDSYYGWADYHKANKHLPDYTKAWVLVVK